MTSADPRSKGNGLSNNENEFNADGEEDGYTIEYNDIIVKSELLEEGDNDQDNFTTDDYAYNYLDTAAEAEDDPIFQYDDGSEGGLYVREMVKGTPEQRKLRQKARLENMNVRSECPVCGDRVNGIHYGIYTCEGCKNFFKRSMSIKKPYVCNNQGLCDVGVFVDFSGIKRKGTRCQSCRFLGCLNSGMIHQGHNRSTGRPRRTQKTDSPKAKRLRLLLPASNTGTNYYLQPDNSMQNPNDSLGEKSEDKSILEAMLEAPALEYKNTKNNEFTKINIDTQASVATSNEDLSPGVSYEQDPEVSRIMEEQHNAAINLLREQLKFEKNKNLELERQLKHKDEQSKTLEIQLNLMERHMVLGASLSTKLKSENQRLKGELKRLSLFKGFMKKGRRESTRTEELENGFIDPLSVLDVSHDNGSSVSIKEEPEN
ncbi:nuclear receptor subfamily 1 group D member 2 isoform X2 [Eurytemora carolleeae]|uniref:nuclear receptor subfamily 1 group D member 2 isoform X2 n=1 Tax=Eurytemora carolleeae TaxID=1294199 RepID=UPI000C772232|nr:nuclear receptor subfamily 1 group D member 2 isoform X2 [Eurytemora carolleeae]|eukprot:XP_023333512.1 nuclear receptor subfamily 1 group D member 2-like isoform X2 [Eurytemora affinis]